MPAHDRPKRHSVKAVTKAEKSEADAVRNKEAEKARAVAATKKRAVKMTLDDVSDRFSKMHIAGSRRRRHRVTRRKARGRQGA